MKILVKNLNRKLGYRWILFLAVLLVVACQKSELAPSSPSELVAIKGYENTDTLFKQISVQKDSIVVVGLTAVMSQGQPALSDHYVKFRVDTTKMDGYRDKYGNAETLPQRAYFFFRQTCHIPKGASESDSIQLNLVSQQQYLEPLTLYVLPLVIDQVDDNQELIAKDQVFYLVIETGKSLVISKASWKIAEASSYSYGNPPENVLDNDDQGTFWMSALFTPMPQYIVVDLGKLVTFSGVSYLTPPAYYASGGYPTKVRIEVSEDGNEWVDKGLYDGRTTPGMWEQEVGITRARYLRFTVEEAIKVLGMYDAVVIGGIGLIP